MTFPRVVRVVGLAMLGAILGSAAVLATGDVLAQLGMKETDARAQAVDSIGYGAVSIAPVRQVFKALAPPARATLVTAALTWAKAYTETADFADRYASLRANEKPEPPKSAEERFKELQEDQKTQLDQMKANVAGLPPELRKDAEENIRQAEQLFADPEQAAMAKESCQEQASTDQVDYTTALARWTEEYPQAARTLIARRLRAFLEVSATVDFDARLVERGSRKVFADAQFERQPRSWKICYRAGKPAVDAARAFATVWLGELERSGRPVWMP